LKDEREQSSFGSGVTPVSARKGSLGRSLAKIAVVFFAAALVPFALTGWGDFYQNIVEHDPPLIELKKPPVGIGLDPAELDFTVRDQNSGIDQVTARIEQGGKTQVVLRKEGYPQRIRVDELALRLDGKALGLREGEAHLTITAYDKSFWSNGTKTTIQLRVDYHKPELSIFPDQRNAVLGGTEMVFYKLSETVDTFSGVMIGTDLLPGFPAKNFDKDFANVSGVYCAFFPVTRPANSGEDTLRIFARDAVGNMNTVPVNYRVANASARQSVEQLVPEQAGERIDQLYEEYLSHQARLNGQDPDKVSPSASDSERVSRFKAVNEQYRALLERGMKPLFAKPKPDRYWEGSFARLANKELHSFGERITYKYNDETVGEYTEQGTVFSAPSGTPARAANSGVIIFAGDLGTFGKTVIVDHGFGLTTLYGHLSAVSRLEGDRVERGDVIGSAGDTGLNFAPSVLFQVRIYGVPVRPAEWWDGHWLDDHVELKAKNAKKNLGIRILTPLD